MAFLDAVEVVQRLNWMLGGWANYFYLGPVTKAYRSIDAYTKQRLRRWLCGKHKEPGTGLTRFPDEDKSYDYSVHMSSGLQSAGNQSHNQRLIRIISITPRREVAD